MFLTLNPVQEKVIYKLHTPKSIWIVIDKYTIKTYLKTTFKKHLRFHVWLGSWKESAAKHMKEVFPSHPHLNIRYLSKIRNFTTDMTNK